MKNYYCIYYTYIYNNVYKTTVYIFNMIINIMNYKI